MTNYYDGYQVLRVGLNGQRMPVSGLYGHFKDAVFEKLRLQDKDPQHLYEIQGIINCNNNK